MTLLQRNRLFVFGIALSALMFLAVLALSVMIVPSFGEITAGAARRASGILQPLMIRLLDPSPYVPYISMILACTYSLATTILIFYFFEKTQSSEILFFSLFVLSFTAEVMRTAVPLFSVLELPHVYLIMTGRVLYFGRYFGLLSLFAASVYAAGLDIQKQGTVILISFVITMLIAIGIPIDGLSWDTSFTVTTGYSSMFTLAEAGIGFITILSFFIAAYSRGSKEYTFIGIGSLLVYIGRNVLLTADTWPPLPLAIAMLAAGTWLTCTRIHQVYLWL
ncbi:DUF3631 domain-containing protein [Breznakiella homolactica]|uniref:Uncharacterized protein n=1 Tax=Breznakiella homolactica TaxID=2798577 RepID=A0A7T8BB09_9SPIR|nr:DUF3631 domain-containing protein [Breznakiella homolactica]QQO09560.1 DUF3631 domain-containing protein [Breznakiella homolactica]